MNPTRRAHTDHDWHDEARQLRRELRKVTRENERLREALTEIREAFTSHHMDEIARRALDGGGGEQDE
jgi:transposase-like protein